MAVVKIKLTLDLSGSLKYQKVTLQTLVTILEILCFKN